jgi:hypothetical protein
MELNDVKGLEQDKLKPSCHNMMEFIVPLCLTKTEREASSWCPWYWLGELS